MRCPSCGSDNRVGALFCVGCGAKLDARCAKCGFENPAHARFCERCGTSLNAQGTGAAPRPIAIGKATNPSVIPSAARNSESEAAAPLDGERKTVTVLFADIKGSMELIEDLDPEEARAIVDPALKLMIDAVHRYDGLVAQSMGDGIFALFGAPIAHEDHPQRALYAALRMQDESRRYANQLRAEGKSPISIRVGVNTGEVVVRSVRKDADHSDYVPVGHSTGLAERMQALATPGSIAISEHTRKLVEGYFALKALGPTKVKGVSEPINVYEVTGLGPLRTRLQRSAGRGLSKFVGRQAEMESLKRAAEQAKAGHGQIVAAMAEAGVGKSRLFYEFKVTTQSGWMVLETFSVSHGKASAYLPIIDLLHGYFEIKSEDDRRKRREKVTGRVLALDRALEDTLPYLFALLGVVEGEDPLAQMDAQVKKRRTLDAIKRILLRESLNQPLIVMFEDLHWIDDETQALLNLLADSIGTSRILLLVNYRPEYTHQWGSKTYYTQLRLDPLGRESADEMLTALLAPSAPLSRSVAGEGQGEGADLSSLKRLIIERTEGNPFFMEETVQVLLDEGALVRDGTIKLTKPLGELKIPPTVQAILAARIDRLPPAEKDLLQTLAVIGKEFPLGLVRAVTGKSDEELGRLLGDLQLGEFIYEQPAVGDVEYTFKHALTLEVAANSILIEKRKLLHERTAQAIESLFADRLDDHLDELAHHYERSANTWQAVKYLHLAGRRAMQRSAYAEAISKLSSGLELLKSLPDTPERSRAADETQRYSLLMVLGEAQWEAGKFLEAHETFLSAAEVARSLGSTESLVRAALELVHMTQVVGLPAPEAVRLLEEALQRLGAEDSPVKARTLGGLARYLGVTGERQQLMSYAPQAVAMARRLGDPELVAYSLLGMFYTLMTPEHAEQRLAIATEMQDLAGSSSSSAASDALMARWSRAYCLLELGDMAEADAEFDAHGRWGEETSQPFFLSLNAMVRAMRALMRGRFEDSERSAQQAFAIGQQLQTETAAGVLGLQMFALRREQGRLRELEAAVRFFVQQQTAAAVSRPSLALIYSELGRTTDARAEFESLAQHDFADLPRDSLWMGTMSYLADVCTFLGDRARADTLYQILFPFAGRNVVISNAVVCYGALSRYLGALATTLERWDEAARHFDDALAMNARMEARPWLAHTQYQYARMLLARDQAGDGDKAAGLLKAALATARELGMHALEERITADTD